MIRLRKLYSEDDAFREVIFKDGINLILGDKSVDDGGETVDKHQNGVGKSLTIELIDYCLLRKNDLSRITRINTKYLHPQSFVNLDFECDAGLYSIGRNNAGKIRIKRDGEDDHKIYNGIEEAKKHLKILIGLNDAPISVRDYFNFFIKHEFYAYEDFNELYTSSYVDLMRIHFYLFELDLLLLEKIKKAFENHKIATDKRAEVNRWLKQEGIKVEQLRAKRNQIEEKVADLEHDFDYEKILKSIEGKKDVISNLETEISDYIDKRSLLQVELSDIEDYINEYKEDVTIDDSDIQVVFEKYKKGLGDLIKKDLEELFTFRDQLSKFKEDLTGNKRKQLVDEIATLTGKINDRKEKVRRYYSDITESDKNHIVKSFRSYKDDLYSYRQYDQYLDQYDDAQEELNNAKTQYSLAANKLSRIVSDLREKKKSFEHTFVELHRDITGSSEASFNFSVDVESGIKQKKNFFKFEAITETTGSMGSNHIRAAIYDMSLHLNDFTKPRTLGVIVHDNLIFGFLDKASSIKYLNLMNSQLGDNIQYIAAINSDDFDYKELIAEFTFDIKSKVAIHLTKKDPLFHEIHRDFIN